MLCTSYSIISGVWEGTPSGEKKFWIIWNPQGTSRNPGKEFYFWSRRHCLLLKQLEKKLDRMHKNVFQDLGHQVLRDTRQETNEATLWFPQVTALREFSGCGTGRENPGEIQQTPWVEKMELRIQKDQGS